MRFREPPLREKLLLLVGVLFLVLAAARPQFGKKPVILKREGRDIVFLLDTSLSMLAQDIKPDRLSRARFEIKSLLERLEGDRVALVPFAGEASVLCPLTTDYSALGLFLETVDTDYISRPGTNISDALKVGEEVFDERQSQYKVMILITDGEQLEGDALETARKLKEENIHLYAIGIGSPDGVPIALENQNGGVEHKRDSKGDIVISKLGEKLLVELAAAGGGKYYRAGNQSLELEHIFDDIQKIEKRLIDSQDYTLFRDRFQWPLSAALIALVLEVMLWDLRAGGKLSFSG